MDCLEKIGPAFFGSLLAMRWLNGTRKAKLGMILGGVGLSWYLGPWVSQQTGAPESVVSVTIGLFGIGIVDSVFRTCDELNLAAILSEYIRKKLGLDR